MIMENWGALIAIELPALRGVEIATNCGIFMTFQPSFAQQQCLLVGLTKSEKN